MANDFKTCAADGCNKNAHWRAQGRSGYCSAHFKRWKRYGSPHGGSTAHGEPLAWLHTTAFEYTGDDCLRWPYVTSSDGYARVFVDGVKKQAHRLVCEHAHGAPASATLEAAHSCGNGNKGCVNPKHLRWATHSENEMDKPPDRKGGWRKVTESDVREIRSLKGRLPQSLIAKQFGIAQTTVGFIHRRQTWKHI